LAKKIKKIKKAVCGARLKAKKMKKIKTTEGERLSSVCSVR